MKDPTRSIWREPTQDQLRKFWYWCGFEFKEHNSRFEHWWSWRYPGADFRGNMSPEITLDNLFKYAIPRLSNVDLGLVGLAMDEFNNSILADRNLLDLQMGLFWSIWEHAGIGKE